MREPMETFESSGRTVKLYQDEDPDCPRDWDNLGVMVCWHRRYHLGDEQVRPGQYAETMEGFKRWIQKERDAVVVLPIYIYQHGMVTVTARYERYLTYPDKQWDAGIVGFIYTDRESVRKEYSVQRISRQAKEKAAEALAQEVDIYDQYLTGDVWEYVIEDQDGEIVDTCGGFYGLEYAREQALEAAREGGQ